MSEETEPRQFTYDAFATYATDPDRDLVRDIEDFIESLHRDRLLSNQFREKLAICVDGQDFRIPRPEAANPKTLEQIMRDVVRTCQATSRCLLVFSGSSTASHPWINAEINWWREQPGFGPIFFVLTHGQVSENAGRKLGDDAGQKNSVSDSLPNALALDRAGLSELWFDLRGHYVRAGWRRFRRSLLDRKLSAESSNWNKVRIYSEERFRLATQILALRLEKDLSKEDVLPKWKAAWRLKQRLRRVQLGIGVVLLFVAAMIADRVIEGQRIEELTTVAQAAVNDQEYERAIKTAIQGLPVDGGFFWRRGWSDAAVKKLLAILAGASQMSAYVGQLKSDEYEGSIENRARMPLRNAEFDPSGTKIVTASNAGSVTIWDRLSREKLLTCSEDKVFPGYAVNPGSTTWVRDARFGETAETVLSVGRYGAWIWSPTCKTCAGQNGAACEPKARMLGHSADVRTGMFSPDWTKVVTTSDDETVREWNAASGSEIAKLELPESNLPKGYRYTTGAEYSLDGKSIVVGRRDGLIAVLDAQTRQVQQILQNSGDAVWSVHFDRSAQRVLSSSGNGYVVIWDIRSGKPVSFFRQASGVGKSVFSPDQRYILTTSLDNVARIWDATTLEQVFALKGHARSLTSASFSPDGKQIVTTSDDGTARIWNIGISILPSVVTATSGANKSSAISNDGRKLAVGTSDGHVAVYVFVPPNELTPGPAFRVGAAAITSVSFGRDSDTLVVAADDGKISIWHSDSGRVEPIAVLPAADSFAAAGPDANLIAMASSLGADKYGARVMNVREHKSMVLAGASQITGIEFDSSGNQIAGASEAGLDGDRFAFVWEPKLGRKIWALKNPGKVLSAHFSRDGSHLATSTIDRKAIVWDLSSGRKVQVFLGHTYDVNSARLSSDGKRLVTASSDRTVRIWDVETGVSMLKFSVGREANDAFFANDDSQIIVTAASGDILIYDVSWTRKLNKELKVRACAEKLLDLDDSSECSRTGAFSRKFWQQLF